MMPMELQTAQPSDLKDVFALFSKCRKKMEEEGNDTWSHGYPARVDFKNDIASGLLYLYKEKNELLACITASFAPEEDFFWKSKSPEKIAQLRKDTGMKEDEDFLLLHRLMVDPSAQGRGLAKAVLQAVAERYPHRMMMFAVYQSNFRARYVYDHDGFSNAGIYTPFEYGKKVVCYLYYKRTTLLENDGQIK
jgi:GNAT superfamily N-acetyltransferase